MGDEVETRKSFSDVIDDNIKHKDILNQNEKFHKEKIVLEKDYNEKKLQLQKELDEKSEKCHDKGLWWTRLLVIATIVMATVSILNSMETRKLVNAELFPDFDFKVTTRQTQTDYKGIERININKEYFPNDIHFYTELFNGGKMPINLNVITIGSKCFIMKKGQTMISPIPDNQEIILPGERLEYEDYISSEYFDNTSNFPCEIVFTAYTNKVRKTAKLILE